MIPSDTLRGWLDGVRDDAQSVPRPATAPTDADGVS